MITPHEIKEVCMKWWKEVLLSTINDDPCFPKEINRIGRVSAKEILHRLAEYKVAIELLKTHSKEYKKIGYRLVTGERQFEKIGKQIVPEKISIDSLEDFLRIVGREKEYQIFLQNLSLINSEMPLLLDWVKINPTKLIEHDTWTDTLKVCKYFLQTPVPGKYIRQLPIDIHTKYIMENRGIVQSLLDFLIPEHIRKEETRFELRYNLKYPEPLIRIRFLDPMLSPLHHATDISLTLSEFNNIQSPCQNIFVAENIMNFLTLPCLKNTIALWSGGGFSVSYLKDIDWLRDKNFFYWGDIDAHGFQILNQFRTYFPLTDTVMMDAETLSAFNYGVGTPALQQKLQRLTESERELYDYVQKNNIRLEQEKITQAFAEEIIRKMLPDCW